MVSPKNGVKTVFSADQTTESTSTPGENLAEAIDLSTAACEGTVINLPIESSDPNSNKENTFPDETEAVGKIAMVEMKGLRDHPTLEQVPRMREKERESFQDDVASQGVMEPVVALSGGILLDGRERVEALKKLGQTTVPVRFVDIKAATKTSLSWQPP